MPDRRSKIIPSLNVITSGVVPVPRMLPSDQVSAVSTANGCSYCIHSHTAAARAKGMTDAQHQELVAIIGLAGQTNHLVNALQVPVDPEFEAK